MALEITTVGATVKYCIETTAGTRPTTGYTEIPDVNEAPDFPMDVEVLDASNTTDTITYASEDENVVTVDENGNLTAVGNPGGDKEFTLNHTENVITVWNTLVSSASTAYAEGKQTWFEYVYPESTKSFFFTAIPLALGNGGIAQNEVDTIPAHVICTGIGGWEAKST